MTWVIAGLTLALIIVRPGRINEAVWGIAGALLLVITGCARPADALAALERGTDVYLFLIGMMGLAEYARIEGVFDWLASRAVALARGSVVRLFGLIYAVGIFTTALLSNDATVVVLTPAVIAAIALVEVSPRPYVFACAFIANAASFVLPISNPSNLLVFAGHMPVLLTWLRWLAIPSAVSIALTYVALRFVFRHDLTGSAPLRIGEEAQSAPRPIAVVILALGGVVLVSVSSLGGPLGIATIAVATIALFATGFRDAGGAWTLVRGISWPVIALTAALFVVVTAIDGAGLLAATHALFTRASPFVTGAALAGASNLVNNLPVGLSAGETIAAIHPPARAAYSALVGINLGPNFTASGSLATILWIVVLRRANIRVTAWDFLRVGVVATPFALAAALLAVYFI